MPGFIHSCERCASGEMAVFATTLVAALYCGWTAPTVGVHSISFAASRAALIHSSRAALIHLGPSKKKKSGGGGFGKSAAASPPSPAAAPQPPPAPFATAAPAAPLPAPSLDADAAALLEEAGGDVAKAKTSYIGYTLAFLETEMPELYEGLKTDPSRPDCQAALIELTYDAVAAFLPVTHDPTPTPAAQKKLGAIARAGVDGSRQDPSVLDVGCGTGLLLPFLAAAGAPPSRYHGVDLSGRMIERATADLAARPTLSGAKFEAVGLDAVADAAEGQRPYDVIVFNAALQFFADQRAALRTASQLLAKVGDGPGDVTFTPPRLYPSDTHTHTPGHSRHGRQRLTPARNTLPNKEG